MDDELKELQAINEIFHFKHAMIKKKALLHRTKFSGDYKYEDISKKLGQNPVPNKRYEKIAKEQKYNYKMMAHIKREDYILTFLLKPRRERRYLPKTIIETSNSTPEFLFKLDKRLPDLTIFSIEYTIDFYCKDPESVSDFFYLLRRYMFFPAAKSTLMYGGKFYNRETKDENSVYKIHFTKKKNKRGKKLTPGKYIKIYERGHDKKADLPSQTGKLTKTWKQENINRVRLEFTINRKNNSLQKKGLYTLSDLLDNPQFEAICFPNPNKRYDQIQFKHFIPPRINPHRGSLATLLPTQWEDYTAVDKKGNPECFEEEFLQAKLRGINASNYTVHTESFKDFKKKILKTLRNFDKRWADKVEEIRSKEQEKQRKKRRKKRLEKLRRKGRKKRRRK